MNLESFSHGYGQCAFHIVLIPYKRRKVFHQQTMKERMERIFRKIAEMKNFTIHTMRIRDDHVHIFPSFPPRYSLSEVFQILKGLSAYLLFQELPGLREHLGKRLWSKGKFFRSVSSVTSEAVEYYINNQ